MLIVIIVANLTTIIIGGLAVWLLDRAEFEHLTEALWFSIQTVTTVGYGDVTPVDPMGRIVGAGIMLLGLGFLSVTTAWITSSFVDARQSDRRMRQDEEEAMRWSRMEARLDAMAEQLERLERLERTDRAGGRAAGDEPRGRRQPAPGGSQVVPRRGGACCTRRGRSSRPWPRSRPGSASSRGSRAAGRHRR